MRLARCVNTEPECHKAYAAELWRVCGDPDASPPPLDTHAGRWADDGEPTEVELHMHAHTHVFVCAIWSKSSLALGMGGSLPHYRPTLASPQPSPPPSPSLAPTPASPHPAQVDLRILRALSLWLDPPPYLPPPTAPAEWAQRLLALAQPAEARGGGREGGEARGGGSAPTAVLDYGCGHGNELKEMGRALGLPASLLMGVLNPSPDSYFHFHAHVHAHVHVHVHVHVLTVGSLSTSCLRTMCRSISSRVIRTERTRDTCWQSLPTSRDIARRSAKWGRPSSR